MGNNTPNKSSRPDRTSADQKLIDGMGKHGAAIPAFLIGGVSQTPAQMVAALQGRIDDANAVVTSRATWQNAVAKDKAGSALSRSYVARMRQALLVAFADQVDVLADFGLTGRKTRVVTPEEKVTAAAKARATRAARHTMGKRQKAAIKGALEPSASEAAPAVPASEP
ncbi:MAG TPA: hypothetical protein VGM06_20855 [Polyangiaceae bacterium]|jgi:hypothetical protein